MIRAAAVAVLAVVLSGCPGSKPEACGVTELQCAGTCVSPKSDPMNCGGCAVVCGSDQRCVAGACERLACSAGRLLCSGGCIDVTSDAANCGGCGLSCSAPQ